MTDPAPRVAVLSVGDEPLAGDILDSNAHGLARRLAARGLRLVAMATAGDDLDRVRTAVERAGRDADLLLVTGGLGPTRDDLTRDGVAAALGLGVEERPEYLLQAQGTNPALTEGARLQATFPVGAEVLENRHGTAPGFLVAGQTAGREAGRPLQVACFPGVPSELWPMVEALLDRLGHGDAATTRKLRCCGLTEARMGELLGELMDRGRAGARIGVTASGGVLTVSVRGTDAAEVDRTLEDARLRLGVAVFGEGDAQLVDTVVAMLAERGETLATAESCTGGLLAGAITSVPGSSAVFHEGFVTYANEAKTRHLGVAGATLAAHGAVSEETARAMAEGLRERTGAHHALAVTGIAGPGGGTPDKPVGTIVFGWAHPDGTHLRRVAWTGSRDELRRRSVTVALEGLRRHLLGATDS